MHKRVMAFNFVDDYDGKDNESLDNIQKHSIRDQVESMLLAGKQLADARLSALNVPQLGDEDDVEEMDTHVDQFSSLDELVEAQERLNRRIDELKQQQKQEVDNPNKNVDNNNVDS